MPSATSLTGPSVIKEAGLLQQIGRLRIVAWQADGELPSFAPQAEGWMDEHDSHGMNWAFLDEGRPIAAARKGVHTRIGDLPDLPSLAGYEDLLAPPIAAFTRLVVGPEFRGLGLSKQLDDVRLAAARSSGCRCAVVVTHLSRRVDQLQQCGLKVVGRSVHRTASFAPSFVLICEPVNDEYTNTEAHR
jgi:hypothetical protein